MDLSPPTQWPSKLCSLGKQKNRLLRVEPTIYCSIFQGASNYPTSLLCNENKFVSFGLSHLACLHKISLTYIPLPVNFNKSHRELGRSGDEKSCVYTSALTLISSFSFLNCIQEKHDSLSQHNHQHWSGSFMLICRSTLFRDHTIKNMFKQKNIYSKQKYLTSLKQLGQLQKL